MEHYLVVTTRIVIKLLQLLIGSLALATLGTRVLRPREQEPLQIRHPDISYQQLKRLVIGGIFLVFGLWAAVWLVSQTLQVLILLLISIILAVALRPTVDRIDMIRVPGTRRTIPRALAILIIYLAVAAILVGIGFLVIPPIVSEVQNLIANLPGYLQSLDEALQGLKRFPFMPDLAGLQNQLISQLAGSLSQAVSVLLFAVNVVVSVLSIGIVLVFTFFLIFDADLIFDHFISLLSPSRREQARSMAGIMGRKIEGWLKGTLLLALIIGLATTGGMWALGMPYPYLLGLAAGLFELVPIIGPYLGAAPAGAVALFTQPLWKFIAVVVFFFMIQQIENNILAPHIFGQQAELPPLLVILALLMGGALYGILGALLAVPIAAVIQVLWVDLVVPEIRSHTGPREPP